MAQVVKLCVLGDGGVGKTALTIQWVHNHFVESYDPTIEDSYRKQIRIDDEPCMLEILDTAGQEDFTALRDQWIRDCDGYVLVYDTTSHSSFEQTRVFKQQISRVKDSEMSSSTIILVGNKCDLVEKREVPTEEGQELAKSFGCQFAEASAKTRENIEHIFVQVIREVRRLNKQAATLQGDTAEPTAGGLAGGGQRWKKMNIKGIRDKFKPKDCSLF